MKENFLRVDSMVKECICGQMVNIIMDNGKWIREKDKEHLLILMEENI